MNRFVLIKCNMNDKGCLSLSKINSIDPILDFEVFSVYEVNKLLKNVDHYLFVNSNDFHFISKSGFAPVYRIEDDLYYVILDTKHINNLSLMRNFKIKRLENEA